MTRTFGIVRECAHERQIRNRNHLQSVFATGENAHAAEKVRSSMLQSERTNERHSSRQTEGQLLSLTWLPLVILLAVSSSTALTLLFCLMIEHYLYILLFSLSPSLFHRSSLSPLSLSLRGWRNRCLITCLCPSRERKKKKNCQRKLCIHVVFAEAICMPVSMFLGQRTPTLPL